MNTTTFKLADSLKIEVAEINGRQLVAGLYWEKLNRVDSYMKEAREKGREYGMDIVAIRDGTDGVQAGFAPQGRGAIKHMYSLAAVVSAVIGTDALVAFELPDGRYALVATLDNLIVPGADAIGDRESIEAQFREIYSMASNAKRSWRTLAAPAEFEFGDDRFDAAVKLDKRAFKNKYRLKALTFGLTTTELVRYGAAGALAIGFIVGLVALKRHHDAAEQAKQQAAAKAMLAAQAAAAALPKPAVQIPHPWAKQPPATALIEACEERLHTLPLSIGGWVQTTLRCTNGAFGATYAQANQVPFDTFEAAANARYNARLPATDTTYTAASLGGGYAALPGDDSDKLISLDGLMAQFRGRWQALGFKDADLTLTPPEAPQPVAGQPPPPPPPWKAYTFTLKTDVPPSIAFEAFALPGLRITQIDVQGIADGKPEYTITGALYAN